MSDKDRYEDVITKRKPAEEQTPSAIQKAMMTIVGNNEDNHLHRSKRTTHKIIGLKPAKKKGRITVAIKKKKNHLILICAVIILILLFFFRLEIQSLWTQ